MIEQVMMCPYCGKGKLVKMKFPFSFFWKCETDCGWRGPYRAGNKKTRLVPS